MLKIIEADGWYLVSTKAGGIEPEARMVTYAIIVERAEDSDYGAWCPDLPGCIALGDTPAETITEMKDAIEFHLEGLREDGLPIPHPSTVAATVVTTDAA